MSTRTKVASGRSSTGDVRVEARRRAEPRDIRRGGRSKSRRVRDRTTGTLARRSVRESLSSDAMAPETVSQTVSMLLDVEFDHDELDVLALGHVRSLARAICHEEDEARWA